MEKNNKNSKNIHLDDINPELNNSEEDNNENNYNNSNEDNSDNNYNKHNIESNFNTNNVGINKIEVNDYNNNHNNSKYSDDNDLRVVNFSNKAEKFKVPAALKKTFIMTIVLFSVGALLIGLGFIDAIWSDVPGLSISMWTLGGITFIPGGYYGYLFFKAYKANSDEERDEILDQIPEM